MPVNTLITGGTVVIATDTFDADVAVDGKEIVTVNDVSSIPDATETIGAEGLLAMPDMIDPHIHIDDMFPIDTHETALAAAALEGVASYVDFAWQTWMGELSIFEEGGTLLEGIGRKREKAANAHVDYAFHGAITHGDPAVLSELADATDAGISSFKMFTTYGYGLSNGFMHIVMEEIADTDIVGVYHAGDASLIDALTVRLKAEGRDDLTDCLQSWPDYAEVMVAKDAMRIAQETGAKYYGVRTSCHKSAEVLSQFRGDGSVIRVRTCTHYTILTNDMSKTQGNLPTIASPIHKQDDVKVMFERLADGMFSVVSTDRCGYKRESKETDNWWGSMFGTNVLQVFVPVFHDEAVNKHDLSYPFLVRVMSRDPARIFGMSDKDILDPGTDADLVLFNPKETYMIAAGNSASSADFSIYEGRKAIGRVKKTFICGELVADDGEIVSEPGHDGHINREPLDWDA